MSRYRLALLGAASAATLSACAGHHEVAVAPPLPVAAPLAPLPALASAGMVIPAVRPDGSYPTPNDGVTGAAATWHLRSAINVAALSCQGDAGTRITAAYNGFLSSRRAALSQVHRTLVAGGTGRDPDADMTRLYNFYAQLPARAGFCAAADAVAGELAAVPAEALDGYAPAALARLDQPFVDFFRAYDAWRLHQPLQTAAVMPAPATTGSAIGVAAMPPTALFAAVPRIEIDAGSLLSR